MEGCSDSFSEELSFQQVLVRFSRVRILQKVIIPFFYEQAVEVVEKFCFPLLWGRCLFSVWDGVEKAEVLAWLFSQVFWVAWWEAQYS